jgi:hypothetical protein
MKNKTKFLLPFILLFTLLISNTYAQSLGKKEIWNKDQLIEPAMLMSLMKKPKAQQPPIYNIGFVSNIPGSKIIGAAKEKSTLTVLENTVKTHHKDSLVVIYCGCCPFEKCPNVRPAYDLLKTLGYKNTKILNLPTSLKADWIDKGYPLEAK